MVADITAYLLVLILTPLLLHLAFALLVFGVASLLRGKDQNPIRFNLRNLWTVMRRITPTLIIDCHLDDLE